MELADGKCVPCEGGTPPLERAVVQKLLSRLKTPWDLTDGKRISREFKFKDFKAAMKFVNSVAKLAEGEGHHPNIHVFYNRVRLELTTHAVGGLSENDFILAAKIELLANI